MWAYPPRRILVPVDFGAASARALRVAGVVAQAHAASVDALHAEVLEAPPYFTHDQVSALEKQRTGARAQAERYLREFAAKQGVELRQAVVADGPPHPAILKAAAGHDLIVMGTHGRSGAARWWLGSVAERVVREAAVPVLVLREGSGAASAILERILVLLPFATREGLARRYAHVMSAAVEGEVIDGTGSYTDDSARRLGATMLVVPLRKSDRHWFGEQVERFLRRSHLPLLFVPESGGNKRK
jgi:nucleotide-binding universal stress UspA family protein